MRNCFEMCVCTILKTNLMDERVMAYTLKGKKNRVNVVSLFGPFFTTRFL